MVPSNLKVLTKFGCEKLDECSLSRAHKVFCNCSHARIFIKIPCRVAKTKTDTGNNVSCMGKWETLGKHVCPINVSGKGLLILLKIIETDTQEFSRR